MPRSSDEKGKKKGRKKGRKETLPNCSWGLMECRRHGYVQKIVYIFLLFQDKLERFAFHMILVYSFLSWSSLLAVAKEEAAFAKTVNTASALVIVQRGESIIQNWYKEKKKKKRGLVCFVKHCCHAKHRSDSSDLTCRFGLSCATKLSLHQIEENWI